MKRNCFFIVLSILISFVGYSQTKLINHKSHSGTNENFSPDRAHGNLGLYTYNEELKKDDLSPYKLVMNQVNNKITFVLFKTESKVLNSKMCMTNDIIIEKVTVEESKENKKDRIKNRLIEQLLKLRKEEE